jgi:hypothetical protein
MRRLALLCLAAATCALPADDRLLKLVMPDARVVSGVSLTQLKKTPFGRFMLAEYAAATDAAFDDFVKASGFDPRDDLDEILFAAPAAGAPRRLLLARGAFAPARIAELARTAGARITPFQGIDIIAKDPGPPEQGTLPQVLAFLDDSTAVAGDLDDVRAAIGRRDSGAGPSPDIARKVQALSAVSDAWFVSTVPLAELAQSVPAANGGLPPQAGALKAIREASGGVVFGDPVRVSAELVAASAEDAASLADLLRFAAELIQTNRPGALPLDKLDLKTEGNLVRLALAVPERQLESFLRPSEK